MPALQALDARKQRAGRGVELRLGRLHQRELEPGARVGARAHRLHGLPQQLQQAHELASIHALGLLAQGGVGLRRERQLGGNTRERGDHK